MVEKENEVYNIRFVEDERKTLEWLQKELGLVSMAEVIRYCIKYVYREMQEAKVE